jgi:hypothetical protein
VRIALTPGEIALKRPDGASAGRVLQTADRSLTGLLPLLDDALTGADWRAHDVDIVVSQHFVRHVLTAPPHKALSREEERALVSGSFEAIYGEVSDGWRVDVVSQPPDFGLVGAAMDAGFLAQMETLLARHTFRRVAIRPLASPAARRLPRHYDGWWALVEPGWLSLFAGSGRLWHHLTAQPVGADWASTLPELIARESELVSPTPPPSVWVQLVGAIAAASPPDGPAWTILPYRPDAQGALALLEL